MRVGILDQSPVRSGGTPADAVHETLELARAADRWGYQRYWLAEHHSTPGLAGASPEVLIAEVAAVTSHIRVGSGGVMLPHYSALKVAEQFRMLETLHPGRIDLGIGRAPGSDQRTARILRHGPGALGIEHYPRQIQDLVAFLHDDLPPEHPWRGVHAMPAGPSMPEVWPGLLLRPLHQRAGRSRGHARLPRAVLRLPRPGRAAQQRGRLRGLRRDGGPGAAARPQP
jgi:luciferase family oxidoreductase group 1